MRGRTVDGISVRRLYGQSGEGLALYRVADIKPEHDVQFVDAASAAEAKALARARWARIDAERAARAAELARRHNEGVEDWPELAAVMLCFVLKGGAV